MTGQRYRADFEENCQLFCKVAREWGGWRQSLRLLRQAIQDRSDFGGVTFQPTVFAAAVKHMKTHLGQLFIMK